MLSAIILFWLNEHRKTGAMGHGSSVFLFAPFPRGGIILLSSSYHNGKIQRQQQNEPIEDFGNIKSMKCIKFYERASFHKIFRKSYSQICHIFDHDKNTTQIWTIDINLNCEQNENLQNVIIHEKMLRCKHFTS